MRTQPQSPPAPGSLHGSFGGHETFTFRYGWLKKGVDDLTQQPNIFRQESALWPCHELLRFALSDVLPSEVVAAVRALEIGTYITYQRFQDTYWLYVGRDIDVSDRLREA